MPQTVDHFGSILQKLTHLRPASVPVDALEHRLILALADRLRVLFLSRGIGPATLGEILLRREVTGFSAKLDHATGITILFSIMLG